MDVEEGSKNEEGNNNNIQDKEKDKKNDADEESNNMNTTAKEKIERAALISRTSGKDLKKDHVKYLLRDMKVDFPNSEFNQNKVFDILAEQRVLAI